MRVVDHHVSCGATHITQRIGEEHLAVEALKRGIALKEQHPGVTQHRRSGLHLALLAVQFELVGRGVMLQFLARLKRVAAGCHHWLLIDWRKP